MVADMLSLFLSPFLIKEKEIFTHWLPLLSESPGPQSDGHI